MGPATGALREAILLGAAGLNRFSSALRAQYDWDRVWGEPKTRPNRTLNSSNWIIIEDLLWASAPLYFLQVRNLLTAAMRTTRPESLVWVFEKIVGR